MKKLLFFFFFVCACATSSANPFFNKIVSKLGFKGSRIIGGNIAHPLQFPYAAAIYIETSDSKHFCSGTLLSNQWILTSGQCVDAGHRFTILLGSTKLNNAPEQLEVATSSFVLHPDYNAETLDNDLGLIKLRMPIEFNDYLKPVDRLPVSELADSVQVSVFGWGQINDQDAGLSNDLQWVQVVTIPNSDCAKVYGSQITKNMVCTEGRYNEGICFGDIGSALIQYYSTGHAIPVGIASFVSSNGCTNFDPSGFTRVYGYNDWIKAVTGLSN